MAKNIVGEEVSPKKGAVKESKKRHEARAFLELGDAFGGPNRVFPFTEVREVISRAPQGDEVKGRFLEWVERAEKSGRTQAWGHSLRHLGRTWYWEEAGITWPENQGTRRSEEERQRS